MEKGILEIWLRISKWENYAGLSGWTKVITRMVWARVDVTKERPEWLKEGTVPHLMPVTSGGSWQSQGQGSPPRASIMKTNLPLN